MEGRPVSRSEIIVHANDAGCDCHRITGSAPAVPIVALDFEASCLPKHGRSYPIEVGIAHTADTARSWLIRPHSSWRGWDWTQEAENLHGLTRERIARDGMPVEQVAIELRDALSGACVVADSPIDGHWLRTLEAAAQIGPIATIVELRSLLDDRSISSAAVFDAIKRVDALPLKRHRAGDDARWLATLLTELDLINAAESAPLFTWSSANGRLRA
ncbi:hypothetical protein [Sphingobium yanoikuyae]|uniref:3'-5' exonuclease n=1 Tax=Sphingobium yanoikuyae TaxID=13690 RepID=UPI000ADC4FD3|nr:hypothetical protein [Sphingobium yanoikuyae]MDV3480102.1 hypothetical protein [Sphingobium yanoikuyae]